MNKAFFIGNLTRDPEMRSTTSGRQVCSFTIAVNRRRRAGEEEKADFVRVSAWDQRADVCQRYLVKGKKIAVTGPVSASAYKNRDGEPAASLDIMADDIEFLSPSSAPVERDQDPAPAPAKAQETPRGYTPVDDDDQLPF